MTTEPDTELYQLVSLFQNGEKSAGWSFVQHKKIQAIIKGRIRQYRQMFPWLPQEDFDDVECSLIPRIIYLLSGFSLSVTPNDGRVIAYFALRVRGEADYILKKITGMKQVVDEEAGKTYLKSINTGLDGLENVLVGESLIDDRFIDQVEDIRQDRLLEKTIQSLSDWSNDRIWFRCYILRLKKRTWADIAKDIGYKQTDYTWLKENTGRFITRLKHNLFMQGEDVNCCICGIYTDPSVVSISILDSNHRNNSVWLKEYEDYNDLDRVESKLSDLFRHHHISYVIMNEEQSLSPAHAIVMRYLVKRESFVETVDLKPFMAMVVRMPDVVSGVTCTIDHKKSILLSHIKRAHNDECRERSVSQNRRGT